MIKEFTIRIENIPFCEKTDPSYSKYPRSIAIFLNDELIYTNKWHYLDDTEKLDLVEKFLLMAAEL